MKQTLTSILEDFNYKFIYVNLLRKILPAGEYTMHLRTLLMSMSPFVPD